MGRFLLVLLGVGSVTALGARYPVDDAIDALRTKAAYLETLKSLFEKNQCAIEVEGNRVALVPGALRSEGLVMAVGRNFPGQYLAYHKAPKPQFLANVITMTFLKPNVADGAVIVGTRLLDDPSSSEPALAVFVAVPFEVEGAEDLWMYEKHYLKVAYPRPGVASEASGKLKDGRPIRLTCN